MTNRGLQSWAYLAGFIDGEGCIAAHASKRNLLPRLSVTQKNRRQLEILRNWFDVGYVKDRGDGQYVWIVTRKAELMWLWENVLPFSILKKPQIELALEIGRLVGNKHVDKKNELRARITALKHD